jgi:hypothetical protein
MAPPRPRRAWIEAIAGEFGPEHWRDAYASSGAAALAEILEQNGFFNRRNHPVRPRPPSQAAHRRRRCLEAPCALKAERIPVLPGGLAIMSAAVFASKCSAR